DLDALPGGTPAGVRRVLRRCLERDKAGRYRDIGDVRLDLMGAADESHGSEVDSESRGVPSLALVILLLVVLGAGLIGGRMSVISGSSSVIKSDLVIERAQAQFDNTDLEISPDGRHVAYIEDGLIRIRSVDSFGTRTLSETRGAIDVFWSPDGQTLGYHDDSHVYTVPVSGGSPVRVTGRPLDMDGLADGGWLSDGRIVIVESNADIMQVSSQGGDPTLFRALDRENDVDFHYASVGYGADFVVYLRHHTLNTFSIVADTGTRRVSVATVDDYISHPTYSPTGHILYSRGFANTTLWGIPFDASSMRVTGEPFLVESNASMASVARDGTLAVLRGPGVRGFRLAWLDREGDVTEFGESYPSLISPLLSSDESRVSFTAGDASKFDVWVHDIEKGMDSRLTFQEGFIMAGAWSPDSTIISTSRLQAASEGRGGKTRHVHADGSGFASDDTPGVIWSYDAQWERAVVLTNPMDAREVYQVVRWDAPEEVLYELREDGNNISSVELHPSGSMIVYESDESGEPQVYCVRINDSRGRWQLSRDGGEDPRWSEDGTSVYFMQNDDRIMRVEMSIDPDISFGTPDVLFEVDDPGIRIDEGDWDVAPDETRLLVVRQLNSETDEPRAVSIIQNWHEQFQER
ncbi:MAG: hypothetical protein ACF8GE_05170, partial [Phycisphaerales bacterium JB043]